MTDYTTTIIKDIILKKIVNAPELAVSTEHLLRMVTDHFHAAFNELERSGDIECAYRRNGNGEFVFTLQQEKTEDDLEHPSEAGFQVWE